VGCLSFSRIVKQALFLLLLFEVGQLIELLTQPKLPKYWQSISTRILNNKTIFEN